MVLADAPAAPAVAGSAAPHIVDVLIAERAPRLTRSFVWPLDKPILYGLLSSGPARSMADAVAVRSGADSLAYVADLLDLEVSALMLERLPEKGRCIVVANHPTGIADGLAVHEAVRRVRGDAIYFANADALRVSPRRGDTLSASALAK